MNLGQDLSPLPIAFLIRVVSHFGHGNHQRVRQTVFFGLHFPYTFHEMSHRGHGSSFRLLGPLAKTHRHPD